MSDEANLLHLLAALIFGYLLGSIPFGLIFTRMAGLGDVRKIGSGNIGATNVLRTGRKGLAAATLLGDALKGTVAVLVAALLSQSAATAADRPNVVLVLTDDQGYGDFSCHGNPVLKTPYLDKLHDQSICFTDFHVCPMCTPTRGQIMTGRDALANGAMNVSSGRTLLRRGIPTMADIFAASGYRTGQFGKWQPAKTTVSLPLSRSRCSSTVP